MVAEHHRVRSQPLARRGQQPRQHAHPVTQQPAVGRRQDVRLHRRAVDPHPIARLDPPGPRRLQQAPIDPFPSAGADRADGCLQRRLLRQPRRVRAREATRRLRVAQGELESAPGLLAQMLEHGAAQHRLAAQAAATAAGRVLGPQIGGDRVHQFRMRVEPGRHRLQGGRDRMVNGFGIE